MNSRRILVLLAVVVFTIFVVPVLAATHYFQGFEVDTYDWSGATRVGSGASGVTSAAGDFHAEAATTAAPGTTGDFTRFGGYESTFPANGYTTSMDVYLNVGAGNPNDTRFDWSSAIGMPDGSFRRDFVFNAGFYSDTDATPQSGQNRFVISASNNATRSGAYPKNPGRDPLTIVTSGWYTFEHHFRNAGLGVLAVDLSVSTLNGAPLKTWTLSDATDIIGSTVGGHRYGWLVIQEFPVLAIDNVSLLSAGIAGTVSACKNDGWKDLTHGDNTPFKNQGDCIQYVNTGK